MFLLSQQAKIHEKFSAPNKPSNRFTSTSMLQVNKVSRWPMVNIKANRLSRIKYLETIILK